MNRVLVVDDEKSIRISLQEFLESDGYKVKTAVDAQEALRLLGENDFDVVVSDIVLPRIDGIELLQAIRTAAPLAQVIMMTGEPCVETAAEAMRVGAFDYLTKPVGKSAILRAVGNAAKVKELDDARRRLEKENRGYQESLEARVVELKQEVERRRQAEQAKDHFVGMVSHELRTPLAIAKEAVALVCEGVPDDASPDQKRMLDIAGRNMERLAGLIDDLLDVARLDAGELTIKKTSFNLLELAEQVRALLRPLASENGITIEVCAKTSSIAVMADRERIFQVLMNLASNAVKFTSQGSVRIELRQDGRAAHIAVRDTGAGIEPEDLPLIFDRFPKLRRVCGAGQKGAGLGLSIVKGIVNLHGGSLSVSSEEGKGTVFTVHLPHDGKDVAGSGSHPRKQEIQRGA